MILLDIGLPNLNGLEVARRVRKFAPNTQIVILSQETSVDVVREALSLGKTDYVHKSRLRSDLQPAIEAALENMQFAANRLQDHAPTPSPLVMVIRSIEVRTETKETRDHPTLIAQNRGRGYIIVLSRGLFGEVVMGVDKSSVADSSRCKICDSDKLTTFLAEVCLHPPGLKNISRPNTFLFPEIALCLDCGVANFTVDKDQLPALAKGFSTQA